MCANNTANGEYCVTDLCGEYRCNWSGGQYIDHNGNKEEANIEFSGGVLICLIFIIFAFICIVIGIIYVQPYRIQRRICIVVHFARLWFILAFLLLFISIIAFVAGDTECYANSDSDVDYTLGTSIILDIIGMILIFFAMFIAM